jgi:hypothetical protein
MWQTIDDVLEAIILDIGQDIEEKRNNLKFPSPPSVSSSRLFYFCQTRFFLQLSLAFPSSRQVLKITV